MKRATRPACSATTPDRQAAARWHFRVDGADHLAESDGQHWSLAAGAPAAPADVTITGTRQALTGLVFAGADADIDISGDGAAVRLFGQLIGTLATVVAADGR